MRKLSALLHIIDLTSEYTGKIISFLMILIIGTVIWWIVLRYAFNLASPWHYETIAKFLAIYIIFGAAYTLRLKAYVNVDILYQRFSPRVRSIIDLVTFVAFLLFCVAMLWMAIQTAVRDAPYLFYEPAEATGKILSFFWPPNWPITLLVPIGVSLFLLQGLAKFIRDLVMAITGKELV